VLFKFLIKDKLNFDVFYSEFMPKLWKLSERLALNQGSPGKRDVNCPLLRSGHIGGQKSLGPLEKPHESTDYVFFPQYKITSRIISNIFIVNLHLGSLYHKIKNVGGLEF
jgi:hypothetical protein